MFISFEGLDGSGKTTQLHLLVDHLEANGYRTVVTREPGGTVIGDKIRDILHDLNHTEMDPRTELLLYTASRAQLVAQIIRPALEAGAIVLSDRFADSTLAYQGYGHGLDLDTLGFILGFATSGLKPDVTVYLDIDPKAGLERRLQGARNGEEWNRLDAQKIDFHQRVYEGYQALIAAEPDRWLVIDATDSIEAVQFEIQRRLVPYMP
ncbi:MAG: dTMP kinase [Chloroflexi bacterium]|nr:dTMP kinase [Chloroflexota bacterium]